MHLNSVSLNSDSSTLHRDAALASVTINYLRGGVRGAGLLPCHVLPKIKLQACYWSANSILTDPHIITAIWKPENSPNQTSLPQRKLAFTARLFASAIFCVTRKTDPVLTHRFYNHVTAPAPIALVHMPSSLTEKRCGLIQRSQIALNPGVSESSRTVQKRGKYKVTTCGVLRA